MSELRSVWVLGRSAARHHVGESARVPVDQPERGVRYPAQSSDSTLTKLLDLVGGQENYETQQFGGIGER